MGFFRIKPIARLILKREISGSHTISDQSLLLSTIVLNDIYLLLPVNDCPDDKYLNEYVRGKVCAAGANKWRDLGIVLMGQDAVPSLDVIRLIYPNDVEECCSIMFTRWRQRTPTASWKQLIEALKEVELTQLASELELLLTAELESLKEQITFVPKHPFFKSITLCNKCLNNYIVINI